MTRACSWMPAIPRACRCRSRRGLQAVVAQVIDDDEFDIPDRDSLKRFAMPDLAPCLRSSGGSAQQSPAVRELLLLMIWLGELTSCADLASPPRLGLMAIATRRSSPGEP